MPPDTGPCAATQHGWLDRWAFLGLKVLHAGVEVQQRHWHCLHRSRLCCLCEPSRVAVCSTDGTARSRALRCSSHARVRQLLPVACGIELRKGCREAAHAAWSVGILLQLLLLTAEARRIPVMTLRVRKGCNGEGAAQWCDAVLYCAATKT
jgi:hypothetical protein